MRRQFYREYSQNQLLRHSLSKSPLFRYEKDEQAQTDPNLT